VDRISELVQVYYENGWLDLIYSKSGIPIPFDKKWKRLGFNLSGGADSAILLYNILQHINENNLDVEIHTVSHIRCWKTRPWQRYVRLQVIAKIRELFPNIKIIAHENYIAPEIEMGAVGSIIPYYNSTLGITVMKSGDQLSNSSYSEYISHHNKFDVFYCATTSNPDMLSDPIYGGAQDRNRERVKINYNQLLYGKITHAKPYLFLTKNVTIRDYYSNNIIDLLHITRSCEQDNPNLLTQLSISQGINNDLVKHSFKDAWRYYRDGDNIPVCKSHCFWCLERNFAIKENE
jgi:hypothetical protein